MTNQDDQHHQRMLQALHLAQQDLTRVSPNPKVGCVIYNQNHVCVATGVTGKPGSPHAEIHALHALAMWQQKNQTPSEKKTTQTNRRMRSRRGSRASSADTVSSHVWKLPQKTNQIYHLYVTLEPCTHYGRTPPCVDAIIQSGITHVYIGTLDPNPQVSGRSILILEQAGIEVYLGIAEQACHRWHAPFKKWITQGMPWVTLKGAMTLDGCLATAQGHSQWITGSEARTHVHQIRAQVDALMIGGGTARIDQPRLSVRHCAGSDPIAVVVSRTLALPKKLPCVRPGTLCIHGPQASAQQKQAWHKRGVELIEVALDEEGTGLDLKQILQNLAQRGIIHLLIEGGGKLHASFIQAGLIDDVMIYMAPKIIGKGRPLFALPSVAKIDDGWCLDQTHIELLGSDWLITGTLVTHEEYMRLKTSDAHDVQVEASMELANSLDESVDSLDESVDSLDESVESLDESVDSLDGL